MDQSQKREPANRVNVITFTTDICEDSVTKLISYASEAMNSGSDSLILMMSSTGGDLPAAFTAFNFLTTVPMSVTTYNIGNIESASNLIFLAGGLRAASSTSQFMLHGITSPANAFTRAEISAQSDRLDLDIKRYAEVFRERTHGCTAPMEIEMSLGGFTRYLSADEARQAGITNAGAEAVTIPAGAIWKNVC